MTRNPIHKRPGSTATTTNSPTMVKYRAHQHKKQKIPTEHSKSAWALASPRFAGATKYHEAMMTATNTTTPSSLRRQTMTSRTIQSPRSCILSRRRRRTGGFDGEERYDPPALEVMIPSCNRHLNINNASGDNSREDVSGGWGSLKSPPRNRRLDLEYKYNDIIRRSSSSLTDSHDSDFSDSPLVSPVKKEGEKDYHLENEVQEQQQQQQQQQQQVTDGMGEQEEEQEEDGFHFSRSWNNSSSPMMQKDKKLMAHEGDNDDEHNNFTDEMNEFQTYLSCQRSQKEIEIQQSQLVSTVPQLLLTLQKLESTVVKLSNQLREKDEIIEDLKSTRRDEIVKKAENSVVKKRLSFSDGQVCYSSNLDLESSDGNASITAKSLVEQNKDEIKELKEVHQDEIMALKEIHRRDFLDLQDKTLKWIVSKSDLMQEQSKSLAHMKEEMAVLRKDNDELKITAKEAFVEAQKAIAKNCKTLASYVEEEIRDSEQAANGIIDGLQCELEDAHEQIALLRDSQKIEESEQETNEAIDRLKSELEDAYEQISLLQNLQESKESEEAANKTIDVLRSELEDAYEQIVLLQDSDEIKESDQADNEIIDELRAELEDAHEQIALLQNASEMKKPENDNESNVLQPSSIPNIQSWQDFSVRFRDAIDGKMTMNENVKNTKLDSAAMLKAESLFRELCFDTSFQTNSSTDSDDFQDSFEDEQTMQENICEQNTKQSFELVQQ